jgi:replicative DNA helicase
MTFANGQRRDADARPTILPLEDRLPPYSLEAERGTLGAMLLDNATAPEVMAVLTAEDYYRDAHQVLYREIAALADLGTPFDAILLIERLKAKGSHERVGGDDGVIEILNGVPHAANAKYHAAIVREKSIKRRLIAAANEILRDCYADADTAEATLTQAERLVYAIGETANGSESLHVSEFLDEAMARLERRREGECGGVATGFADLDEITDGLPNSGLCVLAARPGHGKSALALNVAEHAALEGGTATLFVSLEMSGVELAERLMVSRARIDGHSVRTGARLNPRDRDALDRAYTESREARLWIDDAPYRTTSQIAALARRARHRHGIGLVVIDYIQLIEPDPEDRRSSRQEQVAKTSRRLKTLAKELGCPVLALSQLNREAEKREDHTPRMSDLRESGAIEQDADLVIFIHRPECHDPEDRPGLAEVILGKQRNGRTGIINLTFSGPSVRFENFAPAPEYAVPAEEPFG